MPTELPYRQTRQKKREGLTLKMLNGNRFSRSPQNLGEGRGRRRFRKLADGGGCVNHAISLWEMDDGAMKVSITGAFIPPDPAHAHSSRTGGGQGLPRRTWGYLHMDMSTAGALVWGVPRRRAAG
jgi:hypothetical protein